MATKTEDKRPEVRSTTIEDPRELIETYRRLGDHGPAYQIVELDDAGNVMIEVVHSGEKVTFPLEEVLKDPIAETIP